MVVAAADHLDRWLDVRMPPYELQMWVFHELVLGLKAQQALGIMDDHHGVSWNLDVLGAHPQERSPLIDIDSRATSREQYEFVFLFHAMAALRP
jgi:hypothetical protein